MKNQIWQKLQALESSDIVARWHSQIHRRTLNLKRTHEIISSAQQAREFFRNAEAANDSVKSLLIFYGVASLARAAILLLKKTNGEDSLVQGHGLETVAWKNTMSGDISHALRNMGKLEVKSGKGLFDDFLTETENRMSLHINSSSTDGILQYPKPETINLTFHDLLSRLPDLSDELRHAGIAHHFAYIDSMDESQGWMTIKFRTSDESLEESIFNDGGLQAEWSTPGSGKLKYLGLGNDSYQAQFLHSYLNKTFGTIPSLHIVKPFSHGIKLSQLAVTYILAYYLGMLSRYYPTHWVSLQRGVSGDSYWPAIRTAQQYIETAFPEMIIELLLDTINGRWPAREDNRESN